MQKSLKTYDLINGIKRDVWNSYNPDKGDWLLKISEYKYELLHGITTQPKQSIDKLEK